jgi:hypothetical protein
VTITTVPTARAGWLKVSMTRDGTTATVDPAAGEVPMRESWASAVPAAPIRRAITASTIASDREGAPRSNPLFGVMRES